MVDKLKECIPAITCYKSFLGCFNNSLRYNGECEKCLHLLLEEHDAIVRQNFAKQILDYWEKQGTAQTILFLKDIAEVD